MRFTLDAGHNDEMMPWLINCKVTEVEGILEVRMLASKNYQKYADVTVVSEIRLVKN
tara:strand:- start:36568 stop:36738 length:171 start_codon:yes stop_codon:yes gene_type:complete